MNFWKFIWILDGIHQPMKLKQNCAIFNFQFDPKIHAKWILCGMKQKMMVSFWSQQIYNALNASNQSIRCIDYQCHSLIEQTVEQLLSFESATNFFLRVTKSTTIKYIRESICIYSKNCVDIVLANCKRCKNKQWIWSLAIEYWRHKRRFVYSVTQRWTNFFLCSSQTGADAVHIHLWVWVYELSAVHAHSHSKAIVVVVWFVCFDFAVYVFPHFFVDCFLSRVWVSRNISAIFSEL